MEKTCAKVHDIFPQLDFNPLQRPLGDEDVQFLSSRLEQANDRCSLQWMLAPDDSLPLADTDNLRHLSVINIIQSITRTDDSDNAVDVSTIVDGLKISFTQMSDIEKNTRQQRNSSLWQQLRQNRLTASNFGPAIAAADKHVLTDSLFNKLKGILLFTLYLVCLYNISNVSTLKYSKSQNSKHELLTNASLLAMCTNRHPSCSNCTSALS